MKAGFARLKSCALNAKKERERVGQVNLQLHEAGRSGHEVVEVIDLHYAWDEQVIVDIFHSPSCAAIALDSSVLMVVVKRLY